MPSFFVNELDGTGGTSDSNIVRIRANFVDLDNISTATVPAGRMISEMHPAIWVQSSPGKHHLYFRFPHHADAAHFRVHQQKLAIRYGGDGSVSNPARIMRLPGFLHQKGAPFLVRWEPVINGQDTTPEALAAALQGVQVLQEAAGGTRHPLGTLMQAPSREWLQAVLDAIDPNDLGRDAWTRVYWAFMQAGWSVCGREEIWQMLAAWCARFNRRWEEDPSKHGNDPDDNRGVWINAVKDGTSTGIPTILRAISDDARPQLESELRRFDPYAAFSSMSAVAVPVQPGGAGAVPQPAKLLQPLSESMGQTHAAKWLIKGILPAQSAGIMFSQPRTGKSFVAIDMAASVAGAQMFNLHKSKLGHVVYIVGEGHAPIANRFKARLQNDTTGAADRIHVSSRSIALASNTGDTQALMAELDGMPVKPALIVVDTLFRATAGMDVNDHAQMSEFWKTVDTIKERYGCTVLIVHHSGWNDIGRSFGSMVLLANADFEISVTAENDGSKSIECTKQKDAEEFAPINFKLKVVGIGWVMGDFSDLERLTSCAIEFRQREQDSGKEKDKEARQKAGEYETPSRAASRKVASLIARIHDRVCEAQGIALAGEPSNVKIPESLIKQMMQKHEIGLSSSYRDGIQRLLNPSGKISPWIHSYDESERAFTLTGRLLRFARAECYDLFENTELTPEQIARCLAEPDKAAWAPGGPGAHIAWQATVNREVMQ